MSLAIAALDVLDIMPSVAAAHTQEHASNSPRATVLRVSVDSWTGGSSGHALISVELSFFDADGRPVVCRSAFFVQCQGTDSTSSYRHLCALLDRASRSPASPLPPPGIHRARSCFLKMAPAQLSMRHTSSRRLRSRLANPTWHAATLSGRTCCAHCVSSHRLQDLAIIALK